MTVRREVPRGEAHFTDGVVSPEKLVGFQVPG